LQDEKQIKDTLKKYVLRERIQKNLKRFCLPNLRGQRFP